MTLNHLKWSLYVKFCIIAHIYYCYTWYTCMLWMAFGNNCMKMNKDMPVPSKANMLPREFSFWQYKVYVVMGKDSLEKGKIKPKWGTWILCAL